MGYLIVVAGAILIGAASGLATEFLEHSRWLSVVVGLVTAIVTSLLGTTKTVLEIVDKGLDISRKKRDLEKSNAAILVPTQEEISKYGGFVYRQVSRKAHVIVNRHEQVESREFVVNSDEERR
ncbi:MAG TPA: hypothetical protein VEU96_18460 [Bryobacteraceae bacterium]|nr:hypothetical protein [Bryobacteraceae bacterium]